MWLCTEPWRKCSWPILRPLSIDIFWKFAVSGQSASSIFCNALIRRGPIRPCTECRLRRTSCSGSCKAIGPRFSNGFCPRRSICSVRVCKKRSSERRSNAPSTYTVEVREPWITTTTMDSSVATRLYWTIACKNHWDSRRDLLVLSCCNSFSTSSFQASEIKKWGDVVCFASFYMLARVMWPAQKGQGLVRCWMLNWNGGISGRFTFLFFVRERCRPCFFVTRRRHCLGFILLTVVLALRVIVIDVLLCVSRDCCFCRKRPQFCIPWYSWAGDGSVLRNRFCLANARIVTITTIAYVSILSI